MLNGVPAVFAPLIAAIVKWSSAPGFTVNVLLVPVSEPPGLVAVMVLLVPALVSVTNWLDNTPELNAPLVRGAPASPPVADVRTTVPLKLVTVLLVASRAVILILNGVPADWVPIFPPPIDSTRKFARAPALTVKELLVPVSDPPDLVAVRVKFPVFEIVTLCDANTPDENAAVVPPAVRFPVDVIAAVPLKPVAVLLNASCAVIGPILNAVPAVFVPLIVAIEK
jgi:hypothetical protein